MPTRQCVKNFVAVVCEGRFVEAIAGFYAPEASMQENQGEIGHGRDALIAQEKAFLGMVSGIVVKRAGPVLIDGDSVAINWLFEISLADGGRRHLDEVALQTWEGDPSSPSGSTTTRPSARQQSPRAESPHASSSTSQ